MSDWTVRYPGYAPRRRAGFTRDDILGVFPPEARHLSQFGGPADRGPCDSRQ